MFYLLVRLFFSLCMRFFFSGFLSFFLLSLHSFLHDSYFLSHRCLLLYSKNRISNLKSWNYFYLQRVKNLKAEKKMQILNYLLHGITNHYFVYGSGTITNIASAIITWHVITRCHQLPANTVISNKKYTNLFSNYCRQLKPMNIFLRKKKNQKIHSIIEI